MLRFTIRNLLIFVGIVAIGIAAMRDASELAEHVVFSAMLLALVIALLGAIITRGAPRWVGFTVFGWLYATFAFVSVGGRDFEQLLLTTGLIDRLLQPLLAIPHNPGAAPPPGAAPNMGMGMGMGMGGGMSSPMAIGPGAPPPPTAEQVAAWNSWLNARTVYQTRMSVLGDRYGRAQLIGHAIFTFMMAVFGAGAGQLLTRYRKGEPSASLVSSVNGAAVSSRAHATVEH